MAGENQTGTQANQNLGGDAHPAVQRPSWMDLTPEGRSQVSATKWSKVQKPERLTGVHPDDFEQWEEEMHFAFQEGSVTEADARIYLAMRNMSYKVYKAMEAYESTRGDSYEEFIRDVRREIGVKENTRGSPSKTYNRTFVCEAEKLRNPPALMSNFALVRKYMSVFDEKFYDRIVDRLERKRNEHLEQDEVDDRQDDDPYDLNDVVKTALGIVASKIGLFYSHMSLNSLSSRTQYERCTVTRPSSSTKTFTNVKVEEEEEDAFASHVASTVDKHEASITAINELARTLTASMQETVKRQEKSEEQYKSLMTLLMTGQMQANALGVLRVPTFAQSRTTSAAQPSSCSNLRGKSGTAMIGDKAPVTTNNHGPGQECFMCGDNTHWTGNCLHQKKFIMLG
ncbi:hypothetical protein L218DRAFT_1006843 [Marasmius fiardii PR-910]|nr:hypothetical protein L218DRAFT_1006843 [Marasmius fiardii PR-910]